MTLLSRSTIIVVCFLLALALGVVLSLPKYKILQDLRQKIQAKTEELEFQEKYLSELRQASDKLKGYEEPLKKINSALPLSPDLPALFYFFQKASSQNGLVLQNVSPPIVNPSQLISTSKGRQIEFSLTLSGSYSSFKNFLAALQKSARLISIETIAFSSPEKTGLFSFNVDVKMHSY